MGNWLTIIPTFLALSTHCCQMSSPSREQEGGVSPTFHLVAFAYGVNQENCNLGQKVGDKLMKLSKIGFSMEYFTADFLRFFTQKCQNLAFGWTAGFSLSNPCILVIFWKFPNFLRS